MKTYNKLVRDKIPEIIESKGGKIKIHVADAKEYEEKLIGKIHEELAEFQADRSLEELIDILEVIYSIKKLYGWNEAEIKTLQTNKRRERGGFDKRLILEEVIHD